MAYCPKQSISEMTVSAEETLFALRDEVDGCRVMDLPEETIEELEEAFQAIENMIDRIQQLGQWSEEEMNI